ncbi:MAG: YiiX/YebB-like N1pC/P60 family cysteine hydrolase, partial [Pseudomonadota bacterium]|nr:YiiX/YebB-like N1pC/P60 family cysteine hydrolase [Pseudomonadota bacterium]
MYVIDFERLEAGDIVLTSVKGITSKAIRLATNSDYSHVMLYVGSGIYVHADQKGVNQGNIRRLTFKSKENVRVWRISDKSVRRDACIYARMQSGKKYSVLDAIKTKLPKILSIKNTNRQFCSRLVAQAYEKAGIRIVGDSNNCTPHDIDVSEHTTEVLGCMRRPSVEEE